MPRLFTRTNGFWLPLATKELIVSKKESWDSHSKSELKPRFCRKAENGNTVTELEYEMKEYGEARFWIPEVALTRSQLQFLGFAKMLIPEVH